MGRYVGPSCRVCRREGMKLFLKGAKCETAKCQIERRQRSLAPGMQRLAQGAPERIRCSLREKQKIKRYYGIYEQQFIAVLPRGGAGCRANTGENLLQLLERRLDNVVYKLELRRLTQAARLLISARSHSAFNGRNGRYRRLRHGRSRQDYDQDSEKSLKEVKQQLGEQSEFYHPGLAATWIVRKPAATIGRDARGGLSDSRGGAVGGRILFE